MYDCFYRKSRKSAASTINICFYKTAACMQLRNCGDGGRSHHCKMAFTNQLSYALLWMVKGARNRHSSTTANYFSSVALLFIAGRLWLSALVLRCIALPVFAGCAGGPGLNCASDHTRTRGINPLSSGGVTGRPIAMNGVSVARKYCITYVPCTLFIWG